MALKVPVWLSLSGFVLACSAGCLNALTLLGPMEHTVTHLTGTTTMMAVAITESNIAEVVHLFLLLLSFFLGATFSGFITRTSNIRFGRRYGVSLVFQALVIGVAWYVIDYNFRLAHVLISFSCGLQNALASSYSGTIIRTTHVTGLITDLGIHFGNVLANTRRTGRKMVIQIFLVLGYFSGGIIGGFLYSEIGNALLLFPILVAGSLAVVHLLYWIKTHGIEKFLKR